MFKALQVKKRLAKLFYSENFLDEIRTKERILAVKNLSLPVLFGTIPA